MQSLHRSSPGYILYAYSLGGSFDMKCESVTVVYTMDMSALPDLQA